MKTDGWQSNTGATPGKLALIGGLVGVLVFVLWNQDWDQSQEIAVVVEKLPTRELQGETKVATAALTTENSNRNQNSEQVSKWPTLELEEIAQKDPFAKPLWYLVASAPNADESGGKLSGSRQVLEELIKETSKIVVISKKDRVATIGDLSLRVGDSIKGFRVSEITTAGIVLTEGDH